MNVATTMAQKSPFFHYQLLSRVLRLFDVWLQCRGSEIPGAVGVNRYDIQSIAGQPIRLDGLGQPGLSASQDKNL